MKYDTWCGEMNSTEREVWREVWREATVGDIIHSHRLHIWEPAT